MIELTHSKHRYKYKYIKELKKSMIIYILQKKSTISGYFAQINLIFRHAI